MTPQITPIASAAAEPIEIGEKASDTPRSLVGSRPTRGIVFALAATQVLNPAYPAIDEPILTARDITAYRDEEIVGHEEKFVPPQLPEEEAQLSAAESANRDRLELLARAYVAGQLSTEEEARLAIVSERVRRLIPRVMVQDFEELERIAIELEQIGSEDSARRHRILSR